MIMTMWLVKVLLSGAGIAKTKYNSKDFGDCAVADRWAADLAPTKREWEKLSSLGGKCDTGNDVLQLSGIVVHLICKALPGLLLFIR